MFCKVKGTLNLMLDEISISIRVMSSFGRPSTISNGFEVGRTFEKGRVVTSLTDRQGECRPIFVDQQIIVHTTRKSVASPPPPPPPEQRKGVNSRGHCTSCLSACNGGTESCSTPRKRYTNSGWLDHSTSTSGSVCKAANEAWPPAFLWSQRSPYKGAISALLVVTNKISLLFPPEPAHSQLS